MTKKNGTKAKPRKKRAKPNGRPPVVATPEEFDRLVDEYRAQCKTKGNPLTFTGMALHLGFCDRRSLYDYSERDGFSLSVKRARTLVEAQYEANLSGNNVAGSIFALKNHGWADNRGVQLSDPDGKALPAPQVVVYLPDHNRAMIPKAVLERMGVNGKPG